MKNKKLLYILVPAVLLIWGSIAYRAISYLNVHRGDQKFLVKKQKQGSLITVNDTFTLLLNYPDPFGHLSRPNSFSKQSITQRRNCKWPQVQIYGIISKGKTEEGTLVSLRIDKQDAIIKVGEKIQNVKLVRIRSHSVILSFEGEQKQFTMNIGTCK